MYRAHQQTRMDGKGHEDKYLFQGEKFVWKTLRK